MEERKASDIKPQTEDVSHGSNLEKLKDPLAFPKFTWHASPPYHPLESGKRGTKKSIGSPPRNRKNEGAPPFQV